MWEGSASNLAADSDRSLPSTCTRRMGRTTPRWNRDGSERVVGQGGAGSGGRRGGLGGLGGGDPSGRGHGPRYGCIWQGTVEAASIVEAPPAEATPLATLNEEAAGAPVDPFVEKKDAWEQDGPMRVPGMRDPIVIRGQGKALLIGVLIRLGRRLGHRGGGLFHGGRIKGADRDGRADDGCNLLVGWGWRGGGGGGYGGCRVDTVRVGSGNAVWEWRSAIAHPRPSCLGCQEAGEEKPRPPARRI
jgi:hypothetical protein